MKKFSIYCLIFLLTGNLLFSQSYSEDIDQIINKAEEGNSYFQAVLGEMYRTGEGVEQNNELALKWLEMSFEQGNALAYYNLGIMYLNGQGVSSDREKAMEFLRHSYIGLIDMAEGSNPRAQAAIFILYYYGYGVEVDQEEGIKWLNKAAEKEFPRAMFSLARIYFHGFGVEIDYDVSRYWFEKLAETGDERAQYQLGIFYALGLGVEEDFDRAVDIFSEIQYSNEAFLGTEVEGDIIIEGLLPPKYSLTIEEGSCGETCIWSLDLKKNSILSNLAYKIKEVL